MSRESPPEDPVVTVEDLTKVRALLYRRWLPVFVPLGVKLMAIALLGGAGVYLLFAWLYPSWSGTSRLIFAAAVMSSATLLPFLVYVIRFMWLDYRIARRLDNMARRVKAGETVRASEVMR